MLNWLQDILGEAYTEEIDEKVRKEIGKGFVSKSDFSAKSEAARELAKKLETAQQELSRLSRVDVSALEAEIQSLKGALSEQEREGLIKEALAGYRFSSDYAKEGVISDLKALGLGVENGALVGFDQAVETLIAQKPDAFVQKDLPRFSRTEAGKAKNPGMSFHFTAVK